MLRRAEDRPSSCSWRTPSGGDDARRRRRRCSTGASKTAVGMVAGYDGGHTTRRFALPPEPPPAVKTRAARRRWDPHLSRAHSWRPSMLLQHQSTSVVRLQLLAGRCRRRRQRVSTRATHRDMSDERLHNLSCRWGGRESLLSYKTPPTHPNQLSGQLMAQRLLSIATCCEHVKHSNWSRVGNRHSTRTSSLTVTHVHSIVTLCYNNHNVLSDHHHHYQ